MPFKSKEQRGYLEANMPEVAKKFRKHKGRGRFRGRKNMMTNPGGGFAAAAQRRIDAGKAVPPGLRKKTQPMASGRSIVMPGRKAQPIAAPGNVRTAQPVTPGSTPNKQMPAFAAAARRKIAAQRNA